ncbi:lysophospholipid acyltransferase family protein [Kinneretia asaccharophila]|uniref:Lyso-ornithine lipid acyltransferase n=1 Tax=Roseateles asaccharophilus TaxID=582607 RepID=A0A4R6MZ74_9BURK|nr:lysophospholipid acyltransferase family protein [Roseateles asaccharophilus]MDN3545789.1 lysophospholipid acyltransferase family protein [Roseateles asaccharophilus]TDP07657.1 lyso-ornithine lipid acyltransferase [Roseateles asaccharophilus]
MRSLIAVWRLGRVSLHVLRGLLIVSLRFGSLKPAQRHAHVGAWSRRLLQLLGVRLEVVGQGRPGAKLLVANHVSWLDIAAMHAVLPEARFISKGDVQHWPLVGRLVVGVGTLFIERASKRDALRVVHQTAEALKAGDTVAVFPEGTTGAGPELLPFHANLLQAAIATELPIQPVVLRWHEPHEPFSTAARFIGDTSLAQSLWRIASARELAVRVELLSAQATAHADRRALAEHLREQIGAALIAGMR